MSAKDQISSAFLFIKESVMSGLSYICLNRQSNYILSCITEVCLVLKLVFLDKESLNFFIILIKPVLYLRDTCPKEFIAEE